ncbi:sortase-dependent protein [Kitasatospora sp. NBC_01300]|uniref:sortase-dependent protein n=1 Tax=Kitasatospora sp. NBC_01300 TaxID=2903574 RepID=UPI00352C16E6|nr:Tat pathway signal sequence domain protein [Kitasatospora sp. NBC_01300]
MSRSRTHRSPARRVLAVCALTGGALLTVVTGGQAFADGTPSAAPAAGAGVSAAPTSTPTPARPAPAAPSVAGKDAAVTPTATPSAGAGSGPVVQPSAGGAAVSSDGKTQVREVPKGAAQAGDGSGETDSNGLMLAGGGAVAAVGAGALGFAMLRRRSGARG